MEVLSMNRITRCAALVGTVLSLSGFAQVCQEISLYNNGEAGKMEPGYTFPEAPEWSANWGEMEALTPPYIRFSGQKDRAGDWTGALSLSHLPATIQGGNVNLKVRSTQKGKFGVWLESDAGRSITKYYNLDANRTYALQVSVAELFGNTNATVNKVGVGLFGVPAYQYTTLFLDDIALSCVTSALGDAEGNFEYPYSDIAPERSFREGKFLESKVPATSAAYSPEMRAKIKDSTTARFVLSEEEHLQIESYVAADNLTPQKSRDGWFRNMFFVERNRLKDSVIVNPKTLFYEANAFAAERDNRSMPLLLGNVDYAYRSCADTSCNAQQILNSRVLQAGLPSKTVNGSHLKLYYDPYFVCTNRSALPKVEIYADKKWVELAPNSEMDLDFESAGVQKIKVRLSEGGLTINQNLFVEVK